MDGWIVRRRGGMGSMIVGGIYVKEGVRGKKVIGIFVGWMGGLRVIVRREG